MKFAKKPKKAPITIDGVKRRCYDYIEGTTEKEAPKTPVPPCVDESILDTLSYGNFIVS